MSPPDRTPVLVGVGQVCAREPASDVTPVGMMAEAARRAAADSGGRGVLAAVQSVRVVRLLSDRRPNPAEALAGALGLDRVHTAVTTSGGNSVGSLAARTAEAIAAGGLDVALLTGGEAWRTQMAARRDGRQAPWAAAGPGTADTEPDEVIGTPLEMTHPVEAALGITHPTEIYPLFESARRHRLGWSDEEHRAALGELWAGFNRVAVTNPYAWDPTPRTASEIVTPSTGNRMVATPYTKLLCSNEVVDQAAALILCSVTAARSLGIPTDRWVFPIAAAEATAPTVSERDELWSSPMIRATGSMLWEVAGVGPDDLAHVDLYSCFPSAVWVQADELGIGTDRELTVTGGMRFAGGPWNNYPMHAMATMAGRLRADSGAIGLVTGNGGVLSKQIATLLSGTPPPEGFRLVSAQARVDSLPRLEVDPDPAGPAVIEAATVVHDRHGPTRGVVAARMAGGRRGWGIVTAPPAMGALAAGDWVGRPVELRGGTVELG